MSIVLKQALIDINFNENFKEIYNILVGDCVDVRIQVIICKKEENMGSIQ